MNEMTRKVIEFMKANEGDHTYSEIATAVGSQARGVISIKRSIVNKGFEDIAPRIVTTKQKYPRTGRPSDLVNYER